MVCIQRPQVLISCKVIDICVKFPSFPVILIIAGVLPVQSPALNSITIYTCLVAHSNLMQKFSEQLGPNLVETMRAENDAAEKRIEGESLSSYFFFLWQEQFMKSDKVPRDLDSSLMPCNREVLERESKKQS